jgi:hypothetical protein
MKKRYWQVKDQGILWDVKKGQCHQDDIEMSGLYCDGIISYGVDQKNLLVLQHDLYFPTLRTIPNNTHATYCVSIKKEQMPHLISENQPLWEHPLRFYFDGILTIESRTEQGVFIKRTLFPADDSKCFVERVTIWCKDQQRHDLSLSLPQSHLLSVGRGTKGVYLCEIFHTAPEGFTVTKDQSCCFDVFYTARIANEAHPPFNGEKEEQARRKRIKELCDDALVFSCGNAELDLMTRFAKLRAGESIFETLSGKFHSPGGRAYYAATWCNDQIEYSGPHFAMTGDETAIEASLNAYESYIPFMSPTYHKLPCSIIAEGLDIWEGAGDRGDAAMYLYGGSLFCLYLGSKEISEKLYGALKWCAEYCMHKKTEDGVISSDTDELEGRFPTDGIANLSTSSLCYGGLVNLAKLAHALGDEDYATLCNARGEELRASIEKTFGATLHGFESYRYSKGFETLRAWICLPLCVGITERQQGTLDALLSKYLLTEEGFLTCELPDDCQSRTIWDRSTLYALRGFFAAGEVDKAYDMLLDYSANRLLGDRVPYAVEAYPEYGMRHLSGESSLYCKIFLDGILGIVPHGFDSFEFCPRLPKKLERFALRNIHAYGKVFDIELDNGGARVKLADGTLIYSGNTGERAIVRF